MLSQIIAVTGVNLRSIRQRLGSSAVAIIGIAGVVVVFLGVLSIAEGFRAAMAGVGDPQTVIVMRAGSDTEMTSGFSGDTARLIMDTPGIARDERGAIASPELFVIVGHPTKKDPSDANVPLRGVSSAALGVRPGMKIVEGRMFTRGHQRDRRRPRRRRGSSPDLTVGSATKWGQNTWTGGRHLRRERERRRVGDLVRREGAAARLSARQQLPVRLRAARERRGIPGIQGRADGQSAAVGDRDPRARLLRRAVRSAPPDHPHHRVPDRGADGHRRGLRRGEHDVHRGGEPDTRDRHAAGARVRQLPGRVLGAVGVGRSSA